MTNIGSGQTGGQGGDCASAADATDKMQNRLLEYGVVSVTLLLLVVCYVFIEHLPYIGRFWPVIWILAVWGSYRLLLRIIVSGGTAAIGGRVAKGFLIASVVPACWLSTNPMWLLFALPVSLVVTIFIAVPIFRGMTRRFKVGLPHCACAGFVIGICLRLPLALLEMKFNHDRLDLSYSLGNFYAIDKLPPHTGVMVAFLTWGILGLAEAVVFWLIALMPIRAGNGEKG